jgi:hypothetical protein
MVTSFHINTSELSGDFIEKLKNMFGEKKNILITIEEDDDATWSLLSSKSNREKFKESISQLKEGNLISVNTDDLKK